MSIPARPKIFHIVHVDRLPAIIASNGLLSDARINQNTVDSGTTIGLSSIKLRRLQQNMLSSYPDLYVGQCVPFYFCPRSIMLFMIHCANDDQLTYRGGQPEIVHLQADLYESVQWAQEHQRRWVFTLSNAGSAFFEDRNDLSQLNELNWAAINARDWRLSKDGKQSEFLMEESFPWHLIEEIGVQSRTVK
ncbi:DUF4433 domain-containing protein [Pseudidiomarina homiensis]|uniref:type II toxin-antitoxin system toxin DNA ADP-ribosyl transferase DarT n=1 Tax=Pseudidiomarina homiensis TaxID=364198 RepID=UPI001F5406A0|nr:DUF4433 domain-containing protein [Pseudidiomarina homiensis]